MSRTFLFLVLIAGLGLAAVGCSENDTSLAPDGTAILDTDKAAQTAVDPQAGAMAAVNRGGYRHGPVIDIGGVEYYLAPGAPDGPDGATDIPGHYWVQSGATVLQGKHFNTGPFEAEKWWSSDAPDGALLYKVTGMIDIWSEEKAMAMAEMGFIHYHELSRKSDGVLHPTMVLWLKHIAVRHFLLDGGPRPQFGHEVSPGLDWEFIPNGMMPYNP